MYCPSDDDVPILDAAASGNLEKLQEIKDRIGDDEDFRKRCDLVNDCEGRRVLHYAAGMGIIEMCKFLIEKVKVEIDIKTDRGDTPLLHAAKGGHVNTVEYLIIQGAEIATSDSKGFTSLHYAAQKDNKVLMQLLLMKGADIEANSVLGTPLQCAASCGSVETVRFLLGHGAEPNSVCLLFGSPLMCAIISHSSECMELLLKVLGINSFPTGTVVLLEGSELIDLCPLLEERRLLQSFVPRLLFASALQEQLHAMVGADPNTSSSGLCALARAAAEGETKFLRSLLAAGANPNSVSADRLRPIEHAALVRNHEGIRILFPVTQSIPNYPDWSIHGVMEYFHSEEVKIEREQRRNDHLNLVNQKGKDAWKRQDYSSAVKWYSEAIYLDPSNAKMLSNRSLCWAHLGEATFALCDAEACVRLSPDWPKAHYREGAAWKLLRNYHMSSIAFATAWRLDPQNDEIFNAFRDATAIHLIDMAKKVPIGGVEYC